MTVNTQPVAERPDPRAYGLPVVEQDQIPDELRSLVDGVRNLVDAVANTEADSATLAEADAAVRALNDKLNSARREVGTMIRRTMGDGSDELGTITNIVAGTTNPAAPPLDLEHVEGGVHGTVTLNTTFQGPPGLVHGGWIAALLDQAVGSASAVETSPGMTAKLEVNYRHPTPLFTPLEISAQVRSTERRKVYVTGRIRAHGKVTAEAEALMIRIPMDEG
ncbi:PaaI family thioesterase [Nocardiopsis salina]|uniref:PaaI family thioesterase n=1 Tax=Nocardiopsis salina TaxID=245836 RepID=UPI00034B427B|nr:PaaI family thioesterase [Nocardiopsis salina]